MVKKVSSKKIEFFQVQILSWFQDNGRHFPWREHSLNAYEYIVAEVLLQRTKAETVARFYPLFIMEFPNWQALADAELGKVEEFLKPVGLYRQRGKRLINLAREMVERKGILPTDRKELEQIPFMGQYISNAVELLIFNRCKPLLDVNMARVLERFLGPRTLSDIRYDPFLQQTAFKLVKHKMSKEVSWAILDFASIQCKARNPKCSTCLLNNQCQAVSSISVTP
jgi:A/G-specific adenine glycosylase